MSKNEMIECAFKDVYREDYKDKGIGAAYWPRFLHTWKYSCSTCENKKVCNASRKAEKEMHKGLI